MQIPSENVLSVSWEYSGGSSLAFHKTDAGWIYQDDEAFPVSEEKVMDILKHFESYGVTFVIEDVTDYSQYGLDDPECTLHLATETRSYDPENDIYFVDRDGKIVPLDTASVRTFLNTIHQPTFCSYGSIPYAP